MVNGEVQHENDGNLFAFLADDVANCQHLCIAHILAETIVARHCQDMMVHGNEFSEPVDKGIKEGFAP